MRSDCYIELRPGANRRERAFAFIDAPAGSYALQIYTGSGTAPVFAETVHRAGAAAAGPALAVAARG